MSFSVLLLRGDHDFYFSVHSLSQFFYTKQTHEALTKFYNSQYLKNSCWLDAFTSVEFDYNSLLSTWLSLLYIQQSLTLLLR